MYNEEGKVIAGKDEYPFSRTGQLRRDRRTARSFFPLGIVLTELLLGSEYFSLVRTDSNRAATS